MDAIRRYVITLTAAAMLCALVKAITAGRKGIDFLRRFYGRNLLAREMKERAAEKFCFDAENNVYYTPAFRKTNSSYTALLGIDSMIYALKQSQPLR